MRSKNMRGNNTNNKHRELQRFLTSFKNKVRKIVQKKNLNMRKS